MKYEARIMEVAVLPEGEKIFAEGVTRICIEDDAAGEFVIVDQTGTAEYGKIGINPEEWEALRAEIDRMVKECRA